MQHPFLDCGVLLAPQERGRASFSGGAALIQPVLVGGDQLQVPLIERFECSQLPSRQVFGFSD